MEVASRVVAPVSIGAKNVSVFGDPISPLRDDQIRFKARLKYRQISTEFDVQISIDRFGNRKTGPADEPEVLFLGDSFTFGHGLRDEETFASIYCARKKIACGNLGRSGTGTRLQLDVLRHYLDVERWRPREVKLFVLAMTKALLPGNDLSDNYFYRPADDLVTAFSEQSESRTHFEETTAFKLLNIRSVALNWSNLARNIYFTIGPWLRAMFSPAPQAQILQEALAITRKQFLRLADMAAVYGFDYRIYVLHPVQDLIRGTSTDTLQKLSGLAAPGRVVGTDCLFTVAPSKFYYRYDGHFNADGSLKVAEFLLMQDR